MILMAILVAVQTQSTAGRIPEPQPEDLERAREGQRLEFELARAESKRRGLTGDRNKWQEYCDAFATPRTRQLMGRYREFFAAIAEAEERVRRLSAELRQVERGVVDRSRRLVEVRREVREREAEEEALRKKARGRAEPIGKKVRLPHMRGSSSGTQVLLVVKGGRVYPEAHCENEEGVLQGRLRPKERPGFGYAVLPKGEKPKELLEYLKAHSPRTHFLNIWAYDDSRSYECCQRLKEIALERGYTYSLGGPCPWRPVDGWMLYGPGAPPPQ